MVQHHLQPSFTGGEISPSLRTRIDANGYHTWLQVAQNVFVHPQGGISNRAGTQYVACGKYLAKNCRLISFPISMQESYILEFGDHYVRFFTKAGPVLTAQGTVLELATPYSAAAVAQLCSAQYNNYLYLAHREYPLMRLQCTAPGEFELEEAPLCYGPFMPTNSDGSKKLQIYEQTNTVQSEGVSASLAFVPTNYSNLMVWAYFNAERFYVSETYGLNLTAIVNNFNTAYSTQGLRAYNQGGILRIESAAGDGGDWNGKTLVLEYRSRFTGPADHTVTQTLAGGENAGTQTVPQAGRYILESNTSLFTPLHVGGRFCVMHNVDAQYQQGTLGYQSSSAAITSGSDWTLRTSGTWTGQLQLEISYDLGETWQVHKVLSRSQDDENIYLIGNLNDADNTVQIRISSCQITGDAGYELSAQSFLQRGVVKIVGFISATQVIVEQERACCQGVWTSYWAEGSFSPAAGYPGCVFFFQDRLGLAATHAEPQTLWFSKTSQFMDFGRARETLLPTDSLAIRLGSTKLNSICSVLVAHKLLIFTWGSEWTLSCNGALSLDTIELEQQSERGSYSTAPILVGNRAIFVQARGSMIRDLVYDYATSSYTSQDLTLRAKHLFINRSVIALAYAQEPDALLWCITQDGALLSLTYVPEQGIYAWTHHQTQGKVVSICTLPVGGQDELWLAVERKNGIFIERLLPRFVESGISGFLDSSVDIQKDIPFTCITGLEHLEGETVGALADDNVIQDLTVENGQAILEHPARHVRVGLPYQSVIQTLPLVQGTKGMKQRLIAARVHVLDSRGGWIGVDEDSLCELVQRSKEDYNLAVQLQSRWFTVLLSSRHTTQESMLIKQQDPLPLTILGVELESA